jgi:hypothetical protein
LLKKNPVAKVIAKVKVKVLKVHLVQVVQVVQVVVLQVQVVLVVLVVVQVVPAAVQVKIQVRMNLRKKIKLI